MLLKYHTDLSVLDTVPQGQSINNFILHRYSLMCSQKATLICSAQTLKRCQGLHLVIAVFYVIHIAGAAIGLVEPGHLAVKCKEVAALQRCNDARQNILEAAPRHLRTGLTFTQQPFGHTRHLRRAVERFSTSICGYSERHGRHGDETAFPHGQVFQARRTARASGSTSMLKLSSQFC